MTYRLRRSDCNSPGIRRRRAGRGFTYVRPDGQRVTDPDQLDRIRALVIPPAWTDVWVCLDPRGHIQATGVDARGRRQYRYHDLWRAHRDREKFDHMLDFGRAMPQVRQCVWAHLDQPGLGRERVLACATRLLDLGFFRIGTEGYAEENQTYGLATMQRRHVTIAGDHVTFDYVAKSGQRRAHSVVDPAVVDVLAALKRRRSGPDDLLVWKDGRRWVDVRSADINAYIKGCAGREFSAKDFRTWNATVLAAVALAVSENAASEHGRKRAVARAISEVAHYLGNTPAVCRSSYVDPRLIDRFREGRTILGALEAVAFDLGTALPHGRTERAVTGPPFTPVGWGPVEEAVLDLLDEGPAGQPGQAGQAAA
ncbi:MAG: DNA topoisomerase IB [Actinomycetota bacterium]